MPLAPAGPGVALIPFLPTERYCRYPVARRQARAARGIEVGFAGDLYVDPTIADAAAQAPGADRRRAPAGREASRWSTWRLRPTTWA